MVVKLKKGFTVAEMLVALAVFSTAALIISDIYVISSRAQRKSAAFQKVQSDARLIMANLSNQVREGTIDYTQFSGPVVNPVAILPLLDRDDRSIIYRRSSNNFAETVCPSAESTPCLEVSSDGGATWSPVTSRAVKLQFLNFYIDPVTSPFVPGGPDVQPRVTVTLGLQGTSTELIEQAPIFLQTTISSRVYKR